MDADRLRELLHYDPELGWFMWAVDKKCIRAGTIAGCLSVAGYVQIYVDRKNYTGHRLAWLWMTGAWPIEQVDHIDGDRANNAWGNLRAATSALNMENQRRSRIDNRTGLLGVSPNRNGWSASICSGGKKTHLGTFSSPEEAHQVYLRAKRQRHEGCTI